MPHSDPPTAPPSPTLAVVVPATDAPPTLDRCVAAIRGSTLPPDELAVQRSPAGAGPGLARNIGVAATRSELIVFVDADVVVHPDALARIESAFRDDPQLGALFGSYDDRPAAPGAVSRFRNLLHHHVHTTSAGPAETFWAGLGAVRRDAFDAVGGFDARRFPVASIEDIDLGMRLGVAGTPIRLDASIRGTHLKRWSLAAMVRTDLLRRGVPWARLLLETQRPSRSLNLSPRHRASAVAAFGLAAAGVARRPLAGGLAAVAIVALNRRFYGLLRRRGGFALAAAGLPLHVVHHLTATAALGLAALEHAVGGRGSGR